MEIKTFSSGSQGNCYLCKIGDAKILLECGISVGKIVYHLSKNGLNLNDIDMCIISHNHSDHSKAQKDLKLRGCKVGMIDKPTKIKNVEIKPIRVLHGDTLCYSYLLKYKNDILWFATDFTSFYNFKDLQVLSTIPLTHIMVECNYVDEFVEKENSTKVVRQKNTHASLKYISKLLSKFNLSKTKEIILLHLSDIYSDEILMQAEIKKTTHKQVSVAKREVL